MKPLYTLFLRAILLLLVATNVTIAQSTDVPKTSVPPMPSTLTFAGETVPLNDPAVYDRLEKELIKTVYRQSAVLTVLKRVQRYKEPMQSILRQNNVPSDFFYLAAIESDLSPIAESGKKAVGFWQFTEGAAKDYNLEMSKYVDERRSLERSTQAASQLFTSLYRTFKNWTLCAAAFNGGRTAISNNLRTQNVQSFYDLYVTPETYDYVFRILAFKVICENPERYGFSIQNGEYAAPTQVVEISEDINLVDFARQHNMTYNQLKYYNPWLLYQSRWEPTDKYYEQNRTMNVMLEVPAGKTYKFLVINPS